MIRPRSKERILRLFVMVAGDVAIAWGCLALAVFIRRNIDFAMTRSILPPEKFALTYANVLLVCASLIVSLALNGFYNMRVSRRHRPIIIAALLIQIAIVAVVATLMQRPYPRTILLMTPIFEALAVPIWRRFLMRFPVRPRDTVLVGKAEDLVPFLTLLDEGLDARIRVVGIVAPARPAEPTGWVPYWGSLAEPKVRQRLRDAEELIYIGDDDFPQMRLHLLEIRRAPGFLLVPSQADSLLTSTAFGWVGDQPLVEISARGGYGTGAFLKRVTDLTIGTTLSLLALPLALAIAAAIALETGRPVLLRQPRAGKNGEPFGMWKFRTMRNGDSNEQSLALVREGDERVTRIGWWLRRHRLDEIPQLLNVLAGHMSLVGPRPERPEIIEQVSETIPEFNLRLIVPPGLAGLAQVWAEYETTPAVKLRYDLAYMCTWSLGLDFRILLRAVSTALAGRGL